MMHNPLLPATDWCLPSSFPRLDAATRISVDIETYDPQLTTKGPGWVFNNGYIAGVAVAVDERSWYFPLRHKEGSNLDSGAFYRWFNDAMSTDAVKVMFNAMYDMGWLEHEGVTIKGPVRDPMAAAAILDEHRRFYNLDSIAKDWLGASKKEDALRQAALAFGVGDPKANLWQLPPAYVGPYAEQDAVLNLLLDDHTQTHIFQENLDSLYALECAQFRPLLAMRRKGVRVDAEKAEAIGKHLEETETQLLNHIHSIAGGAFDMWSNKSLAVLYERLKLPYLLTEKGNPSFPGAWLEAQPDEISKSIVGARRANRARSTFSSGLITEHAYKGRIHCEFHPLRTDKYGTISGRYSSARPNLQNIPARDPEIGPLIRSIFLPEEGMFWAKHDYSQQEPRLMVHYAYLNNEPGSDAAVNYYRGNEKADFHRMIAEMAHIDRSAAKTINLGLSYGLGKKKLADKLALTPDEAEALFQQYNQKVPFVKALSNDCANLAANRGFIRTILGRRCRFNQWEASDWELSKELGAQEDRAYLLSLVQQRIAEAREAGKVLPRAGVRRAFTYRAMNRLVQGSAADMIKKALVMVHDAGYVPHIQVHDELDTSLENDQQAREIQRIMETCVELVVPVRVDVVKGINWGELKELC